MAMPDIHDRPSLERHQLQCLQELLQEVLPSNTFYARKLAIASGRAPTVKSFDDLRKLPFTTKDELVADQSASGPYGTVLTYPLDTYSRMHQTSGTLGRPLRWLDTPVSWQWLLDCWKKMFAMAGVRSGDRLFFPFSFGPFLGFWTAFDAASQLGLMCLPGGGMSSSARLRFIFDHQPTVVLCTPTYALHLAEVAGKDGIALADTAVRALIVAGEPGGCIAATRARIESSWGARVFDHSGLTEVGAACIECVENPGGMHLLETEYIGEVIDPDTGQAVDAGNTGELVLTNLGRHGSPVIRYRTGDLVRVDPKSCPCGRILVRLDGGILGRIDDMIHVRGNNVYPSALEAVIRRHPEVAEYRVRVDHSSTLTALFIDLEAAPGIDLAGIVDQVRRAIQDELMFRAEVRAVSPGTLPRFDMKARRIVHGP
jgi:phenylacetate-CoA ligase